MLLNSFVQKLIEIYEILITMRMAQGANQYTIGDTKQIKRIGPTLNFNHKCGTNIFLNNYPSLATKHLHVHCLQSFRNLIQRH